MDTIINELQTYHNIDVDRTAMREAEKNFLKIQKIIFDNVVKNTSEKYIKEILLKTDIRSFGRAMAFIVYISCMHKSNKITETQLRSTISDLAEILKANSVSMTPEYHGQNLVSKFLRWL